MGIGESRLQAKTATGFGKPGGVARLTGAMAADDGRPPGYRHRGIGDRTARRLADAGIPTVHDLAWADHDDLARRFGPPIGPSQAHHWAWVGTTSPIVDEPHVARSRSKEVTYTEDLTDSGRIADEVARPAPGGHRVRGRRGPDGDPRGGQGAHSGRSGPGAGSAKPPDPTTDPATVAEAACLGLFDLLEPARLIRLLGVRVVLEPPG